MSARDDGLPAFVVESLDERAAGSSAGASLNEAVAALAVALDPVPPTAEARSRLLAAATDGAARFQPFLGRLMSLFDLGAQRVREILSLADGTLHWEPAPFAGVELLHFAGGPRVALADNGLVRYQQDVEFPLHRHLGTETVIVLSGAYRDSGGRTYRAGDLHAMTEGTSHSFRVIEGPCLFAVSLLQGIEVGGQVVSVK